MRCKRIALLVEPRPQKIYDRDLSSASRIRRVDKPTRPNAATGVSQHSGVNRCCKMEAQVELTSTLVRLQLTGLVSLPLRQNESPWTCAKLFRLKAENIAVYVCDP